MTPKKPSEINGLRQKLENTRRQAMTKLLNDPERLKEIRERAKAVAKQTVMERRAITEEELADEPIG